jgi:hypothetical protein
MRNNNIKKNYKNSNVIKNIAKDVVMRNEVLSPNYIYKNNINYSDVSIKNIINILNEIELSYEKIIHNKVYDIDNYDNYDLYLAIPKGIKCFILFSNNVYNKNKSVLSKVYLIKIDNYKKKINDILEYDISRDNYVPPHPLLEKVGKVERSSNCNINILNNTLFYGTLFTHLNKELFSIEDIFKYKGKDISKLNWGKKYEIILKILSEDELTKYYPIIPIHFGLPLTSTNKNEFKNIIDNKNKYNIYCYNFIDFNKKNYKEKLILYNNTKKIEETEKNININTHSLDNEVIVKGHSSKLDKKVDINVSNLRTKIFKIIPDLQNDIYYLQDKNKDKNMMNNYKNNYNIALIPDYKTSKMMNKLFRNIKENDNLDSLEESDDEEEFENSNIDKYVNLNKTLNMECIYNKKFKKWVPITPLI